LEKARQGGNPAPAIQMRAAARIIPTLTVEFGLKERNKGEAACTDGMNHNE
jgi:hypothetical protein